MGRNVRDVGVAGSNPATPTKFPDHQNCQLSIAPALGGVARGQCLLK
jgi:hypothetical protein